MNYQKLDAALAMALNDVQNPEERNLVVFIHTEPVPDATAAAFLEKLGVMSLVGEMCLLQNYRQMPYRNCPTSLGCSILSCRRSCDRSIRDSQSTYLEIPKIA